MTSPVPSGANIFPMTMPTVPLGTNLTDLFNQMLELINAQCLSSIAGYAVIADGTDPTKQILFTTSAATTATATTIAAAQTANRTLTLPNATDTLVGKATTDTLTNKTLTSPAITDGTNVTIGTGTGSIIGGVSSLLGFFGITAITKPAASVEMGLALSNLGLRSAGAGPISVTSATIADGSNVNIGSGTGTIIGQASSKLGFFGATAVAQVAYSATVAVATTAVSTAAGVYGFTTVAQASAIMNLLNALRAGQVSLGLGST